MKDKIIQFAKKNISIVFFLIALLCFWISNYIHILVFPGLFLILIAIAMDSSRLFSHKKRYIQEEIKGFKETNQKTKEIITKRKNSHKDSTTDIDNFIEENQEEESDLL